MRIYLAGPMRGYPKFNYPAFDYAARRLRAEGHDVFSPAEHDRATYSTDIENNPTGDEGLAETFGFSLRDALAVDTAWICQYAEAVALLPMWEMSRGAYAEKALADALGLTIIILGKEYVNEEAR